MINRNDIVDNIIEMSYENNLKPFGHRYIGDKRYVVWALAGHGNGHRDTIFGRVGHYQIELGVNYDYNSVMYCRLLSRDEYFRV